MLDILMIEDEPNIAEAVRFILSREGWQVALHADGAGGIEAIRGAKPRLVILDVMLPHRSGTEILAELRGDQDPSLAATPVLMLTALGSVDDRVAGLNAGADDYLVKPFAFSELSARLQALVRRPPLAEATTRHRVADLEVDVTAHRATRAGQTLDLTPHEFKLLERLARNAGHAVTRTMLLESLWGFHFDPRANLIDAHISRLRAKVDRGFDQELIHTIRGVGYVLKAPD